jgi:hypothetical protein
MNPAFRRTTEVTFTVAANTGDFNVHTPLGSKTYSVTSGTPLIVKMPTRGADILVENTGSETVTVSRDF